MISEITQEYLPGEPGLQKKENPFALGKVYNRKEEIHKIFGGSEQSGISPSRKYPYIFLFNTPSGKEAGYEDGWVDENTFYYTGQGQSGDMQFVLGNKALLNHQSEGKELHLFKWIEAGRYKYLGQFRYDSFLIMDGYDFQGQPRKILRFTLKKN